MPVYEYRCNSCQRMSSFLLRSVNSTVDPVCAACGSRDLVRLVSRFAFHKSEQTRLEEAGSPDSADYYQDPATIGRWAEEKSREMGFEMPSEIHEMIGQAREGELPKPPAGLDALPDPLRHLEGD